MTSRNAAVDEHRGRGFSRKWQNALRVNIYPPQGDSLRPAAFVFHKIQLRGRVRGRRGDWRQAPALAAACHRAAATRTADAPSQYARSVGPLVSVERPGQAPAAVCKAASHATRSPGVVSGERKPLYVGLSSVAIAKRFDIKGAAQKAAEQLPALYAKHLRAD